ncbi:MAG: flagellar biosynthesis protein FlhA [Desulfobacterium sp.]
MDKMSSLRFLKVDGGEILAALGVVTIMMVMIIPLPSILLDFLLALNITVAVTILLIAMSTERSLDFAIFPSLLLVTTLFRLSLNVASTRLILLHGNEGMAAAGNVIKSFGNVVMGGNYVVGMIVFIVLVLINFMVITKGATRVAEVAARFTLDAMPGKQMAVDADLNAGLIDESQAKERRSIITREAEFNGAMDGASKFVRGDAVAGIVITLINILGGFIIGVFQQDMNFIDAAQNYTLLTVGDGLVSQIPALIISTASGIVVTRSNSEGTMGGDFAKQFIKYPKAVNMAALMVFLFGMIPGLPHFSFILLSMIIAGISFLAKGNKKSQETKELQEPVPDAAPEGPEPVEHLLTVDALEVEVGYGLISLVDKEQGGEFLDRVHSLRRQFAQEMGIIIPPIHIRDNLQIKSNRYNILIKGVAIASSELMVNHYMAMDPGDSTRKIEGISTKEPAFNLPAVWIPDARKEEAKLAGYTVVDSVTIMTTHLTEVIRKYASELLGRQDVQSLLDNLATRYPKVVEELVPKQLTLGGVQKVLQNLLQEHVSIKDMLTIVETLADYAPISKDPELLTEYVRHKLSRSIMSPHLSEEAVLNLITLAPEVENLLLKGLQKTDHGVYLSLDPKVSEPIIRSVKNQTEKAMINNIQPIIMTSPVIRRHFRKLIETFVPSVMVMSQSELLNDIRFKSIGEVSLRDATV